MIVVDASVLAVALGDDGTDGRAARARLAGEELTAPELLDLEVVSVWRRHVAAKLMTARRASDASDLADLPILRAAHQPLLPRIWELRHSVTTYDAAYVALAEAMGVVLVTADARLARAPGVRCATEVLS